MAFGVLVLLVVAVARDWYREAQRLTGELAVTARTNAALWDSVSRYRVVVDSRVKRSVVLQARRPRRELLPVGGTVSSRFSPRRLHPLLRIWRPHHGIDIPAPKGTAVRPVVPGRVQRVGRDLGFGVFVEIDHGNGIRTRYAHLSRASVSAGAEVTPGTIIGQVGTSGLSTGPHLHYEVVHAGRHLDPMAVSLVLIETVPSAVHRIAGTGDTISPRGVSAAPWPQQRASFFARQFRSSADLDARTADNGSY